jgi:hypothetical protein
MHYDVLFQSDDRPHPRHLATIYAPAADAARRRVADRWPGEELQIVRLNNAGDRTVRVQ